MKGSMKRAFGLITAALLTTSVYSQGYDTGPAGQSSDTDYRSRQSEAGAPASSESENSPGYERSAGPSNSSTGLSNQSNIGSGLNQDSSLITRDSVDVLQSENSDSSDQTDRDSDLSSRGLEPDSNQLSNDQSRFREEQSESPGDMDDDSVFLFEEWSTLRPDSNVGGPAESESGSARSDEDSSFRDNFEASDPSSRLGTDIPARGDYDRQDEVESRIYNDSDYYQWEDGAGAPAGSVSGQSSSRDDQLNCDKYHKNSGAPAGSEEKSETSSDSSRNGSKYDKDSKASGSSGSSEHGSNASSELNNAESASDSGANSDEQRFFTPKD